MQIRIRIGQKHADPDPDRAKTCESGSETLDLRYDAKSR